MSKAEASLQSESTSLSELQLTCAKLREGLISISLLDEGGGLVPRLSAPPMGLAVLCKCSLLFVVALTDEADFFRCPEVAATFLELELTLPEDFCALVFGCL